MIEVVVLINNFKDKENFNKSIKVVRNNVEVELHQELLQKGDIYSITKERYKYLSEQGIVEKAKKVTSSENKGE